MRIAASVTSTLASTRPPSGALDVVERAAVQLRRTHVAGATDVLSGEAAAAIAVLYTECAPLAVRAVRRLATSDADAADIVHDIFLRLPSLICAYRTGNFPGWLTRVAVRAAIRARRAARRAHLLANAAMADADPPDLDAAEMPESKWTRVCAAVARLPPPLRRVVELHALEECSHAEIGRRLAISPTASAVRYCRALKRLRGMLCQ